MTRIIIFILLAVSACATLKDVGRTLNDAADIACNVFGADNPVEFEQHVRTVLPPGAAGDAEKHGFDPRILCAVKDVIAPFILDQISLQQSTAASLRRR